MLTEEDHTEHTVLFIGYWPLKYAGFTNCVPNSLALTNQGLFEVGHYSLANSYSIGQNWQWFLHRCIVTSEEIEGMLAINDLTIDHFFKKSYQAFITGNIQCYRDFSPEE
jgi:hypothetical protein